MTRTQLSLSDEWETPSFPDKKYKTIIMDPPWPVQPMILEKYKLSVPYPTMSFRELQCLPIDRLSDENCILFMWATHTFLPDAFQLVKDYGFKYYCTLTWDKVSGLTHQGIFRVTEFVLVAYKGKLTKGIEQKGKAFPALFRESKGKHSAKPENFDHYVRMKTKEPRLEMFARKQKDGFDVWGNDPSIQEAMKTQ